jgi:ribonuclease P protein component
MNQRFPKKEHLYGNKAIGYLLANGNAILAYPFRVIYLIVEDEKEQVPVRVLVSASKKRFKRAVVRNRIKRLIRESYRKNKVGIVSFAENENIRLHLAFQYIANELLPLNDFEKGINTAFEKIISQISESKK